MSQKTTYLPADFYDDFVGSSRGNTRRNERRAKNVANSNKIKWEEIYNWMLDREELIAFDNLKRVFINNQGRELLQNEVKRTYENREPHEITLKFCYNLKESLDKKSLTRTLLDMLLWIKEPSLSDELKVHAFNHFSQTSRSGLTVAAKAYRLMESKYLFVEKVKKIAKHPWVSQAGIVAIELQLCDELPIDVILVQLWLENRTDIYFEYLDASESSRMKMIEFLDSLMESDGAYASYLLKNGVTNVITRNRKIIKTHIFKLRDRYQLNETDTPITTHYHYSKFLKYIMYEYYDCEKMSKEIYEDKVTEIANKSVELQTLLVQFSCDFGFGKDAAKWKNYYKLNIDISCYEKIDLSQCKITQNTENFYKLPFTSKIIFVDNQKLFENMFLSFQKHKIVGLDCEQQISLDLSIIQIATKEEIFIIDAMMMRNEFDWKMLCDELLNNFSVTKLGCGIFHDLKTIEKFLTVEIDKTASYFDLGQMAEKLLTVPHFKFPFEEEKRAESRVGLSKLTKLCLGKNLNKNLATSSWTKRPLREEQLHYAALDAYCAIEIFEKISELLSELNFSFKDVYYKDEDCKSKKKAK